MSKQYVTIGELYLKQEDIFSCKSVYKNIWNNGQIVQLKTLEKEQMRKQKEIMKISADNQMES